jgi:hypothetical protein
MLSFKEIANKSASTLLVGAIVGLGSLLYAEYQTYQEIKELPKIKIELETKFKKRLDSVVRVEKLHNQDIKRLKNKQRKDSINIDYTKKWVDYWVSLR